MPTVVTSVVIAAPAQEIAAALLNADLAPLWTAGLERLELIEGTHGEAGSVGIAHYVVKGRRYTLEDRLLSVEPNRHYVSEISGGGMRAKVETILDEAEDHTTMTVRWSGSGTNPITWMMLPLMRGRIARQSAADLESLRCLVESDT